MAKTRQPAAELKPPRRVDPGRSIQVLKLIRRLEDHALGKLELRPTQVSAALGLLKKALSDAGKMSLKGKGKTPVKLIVGWAKEARER